MRSDKTHKKWVNGNRAFLWNYDYGDTDSYVKRTHPLQLRSKNPCTKENVCSWVEYSEKDVKRLLKFLKDIFE